MNQTMECQKNIPQNLSDILREYQNANPDEDNRKILQNISRALAHIWEELQGGNIENTQPKKKENIENNIGEFLYANFSIYDEKGLRVALINIAQYVLSKNIEKFIESFMEIFGINISGASIILGRAKWTPIDTEKCMVGIGVSQRTQERQVAVQEKIEHTIRMNALFAEMEALPKAIDSEKPLVESNPEDESISNLLEYTQQAMNEFRVDILEIPAPFLQDLFVFLKLHAEISKLEEEITHKEHLKSQIEYGRQRISAILYPQDKNRRKEPDKKRIRRTERLSDQNSIERRDLEIQSINAIISKKKQELTRKRKQFSKLAIQRFPSNIEIIEGVYKSFGRMEEYPKPRNIRTLYSRTEIRKISLRALLQVANLVQKDKDTGGVIPGRIQGIHQLNRVRRNICSKARNLGEAEKTAILEDWSQARIRTILATTIVQMIADINNSYQYCIKINPPLTSVPQRNTQIPGKNPEENRSITAAKAQMNKDNASRMELEKQTMCLEKTLQKYTQHYDSQILSIGKDIGRIEKTLQAKGMNTQPPQSCYSDVNIEELQKILKERREKLEKLARINRKKLIDDSIGYQNTKEELIKSQRKLTKMNRVSPKQ